MDGNASTGPAVFFESRTPTAGGKKATSTQAPSSLALLRLLFRHSNSLK